MFSWIAVMFSAFPPQTPPQPTREVNRTTYRPVHTFSIVARDPKTGEMGVAVQSHWFSVGADVPWAEAGVGAVATQSLADPAYGVLGLEMMRRGRSAPDALKGLLASDENNAVRQVAMIDATGRVAAHTGDRCITEAGHIVDADAQFSVQANLMEKDTVWPAMAEAYKSAEGDLADRLIAALEAAQGEGGDIRGRQSAALVIVKAESSGKPWEDRLFDLRVEDSAEPIVELKRLVTLKRAYTHMNAGDVAMEHGEFETAQDEYAAATKLAPEIVELSFWHAVMLASNGYVDEALPIFKDVFAKEKRWIEVVPRVAKAGLLPDDPALLAKIRVQAGY